jgi:hypothetical protein
MQTHDEWQVWVLSAEAGEVHGYAGGFTPVGSITVAPQIATTVAPQTNLNLGFNLVAGIGNTAQQGVSNSAVNGLFSLTNQRA